MESTLFVKTKQQSIRAHITATKALTNVVLGEFRLTGDIVRNHFQILGGAATEYNGTQMSQLLRGQVVHRTHQEDLLLQDLGLRVHERDHVERLHVHDERLPPLSLLQHILNIVLGNRDEIGLLACAG